MMQIADTKTSSTIEETNNSPRMDEDSLIPTIKVTPTPIKKLVAESVNGEIDIPEFQRSFVWKTSQVRDLAESICNSFPIGSLLCWYNPDYMESRLTVKERQNEWIIDGQQRTTAFCFIVGRKPRWYKEKDWQEDSLRYETWVDVTSPLDELIFETRRENPYGSKKWISIREVCRRKEEDLFEFAGGIKRDLPKKYDRITVKHIQAVLTRINGLFESMDERYGYHVQKFVIRHDLESVTTIFARLNSGGTAVKETDTILAYIGAHHRGWVKNHFLPFVERLEEDGFELGASLLIRTITGIGVHKTRIKEVPKNWWRDDEQFHDAWKRTKTSVVYVARMLAQNYGVLSSEILPTKNALIPMFALYDRFPDKEFNDKRAMYWFLLATRTGRYGGSSSTALDEDLGSIAKAKSFRSAIRALVANLDDSTDIIEASDLREKYTDRFLRLIFYLAVFQKGGIDWLTGIRLGYDTSDSDLNKGFQPEWHHFFPRAFLKRSGRDFSKDDVNSFANIVVLGQKANRAIHANSPKDYIAELGITNAQLGQQFLPTDKAYRTAPRFRSFIKVRSESMAKSLTQFLQGMNR